MQRYDTSISVIDLFLSFIILLVTDFVLKFT